MNPFEHIKQSGVFLIILQGIVGRLEVEVTIPESPLWDKVALIGHPHSLQGGTMQNKVVTTLVKAYKELNIPAIRFNFRGVGQSEGVYDAGMGESEDMLFILALWHDLYPHAKVYFAGFSFGSYVAYRAGSKYVAQSRKLAHLISIAPPVMRYDYAAFPFNSADWLIIQGNDDDVAEPQPVYDFAKTKEPPIQVIPFPDTGHFFHGKLIELKACLLSSLRK